MIFADFSVPILALLVAYQAHCSSKQAHQIGNLMAIQIDILQMLQVIAPDKVKVEITKVHTTKA